MDSQLTLTQQALQARANAYAPYSGFAWALPSLQRTDARSTAAMWKTPRIP